MIRVTKVMDEHRAGLSKRASITKNRTQPPEMTPNHIAAD